MSEIKRVIEETEERCYQCGGSGQEQSNGQTSAIYTTCRRCSGSGFIVTKRVTRTEVADD